jgi:hypothetical protein
MVRVQKIFQVVMLNRLHIVQADVHLSVLLVPKSKPLLDIKVRVRIRVDDCKVARLEGCRR